MKKLLIPLALILLIPTYDALACSCVGVASPCAAYQAADAVFVGVVKKTEPELPEDEMDYIEQTAFVEVEKGFKAAKAGDEVVFHQPNHNCAPKYKAGQRYLFYASFHKDTRTWEVYGCGRSTSVDRAHDDLLYLERLPEAARQTRISGAIEHYETTPEKGFAHVNNLAGIKVIIVGEKKTYEVYTDQGGVYERYGLPEGKYAIKPEIPLGLKVRFPMPFGPGGFSEDRTFQVELKVGSCAGADFVVSSDTAITGRVIGTDGQPIPRVCVDLIPAETKTVSPYFHMFACTKEEGRFKMDEIPPGKYLIVANKDGKQNGYESFPPAYYPGVFEKEKATVITVSQGQKLAEFDILVPAQSPTILLEGVLLFLDGRPVSDAHVRFNAEVTSPDYEDKVDSQTDGQGHFSLRLLQGVTGKLTGEMSAYSGKFENCPAVEELTRGGKFVDLETKPLRIDGKTDVQGIKLVFPFGYCKKKEKE